MKDPANYEYRDDARIYHIPPRAPAGQEDTRARLMKFYGVQSPDALIEAQAHHIERLQEKLRAAEKPFSFAPQRVREG